MSYIIYLQHIIFFLYVLPRPHTNFWEVFLFWVFCTIICCRTSVVVVSSKGKESEVKWCLLFTLLLLLLLQLTCYYGGVCVSCLVVARAISAPSLPRGLRSQMTVTSKLLGVVYTLKAARKKERKKERLCKFCRLFLVWWGCMTTCISNWQTLIQLRYHVTSEIMCRG
jgi:hypothetical protein